MAWFNGFLAKSLKGSVVILSSGLYQAAP